MTTFRARTSKFEDRNSAQALAWCKTACTVALLCAATAIASPAQTFTTLHSFDGPDGSSPAARLIQAADGNLYGTTDYGGANANNNCPYGCGTVFKMAPSGTLTTLYSFCSQTSCTDGEYPQAALVQASDGDFYGTTYFDGDNASYGTVFKITPSGTLTTLHTFDSTDGAAPAAALIQASDGNFYGTTAYGGANNLGTAFKITPSGTLTTLYSFCSQSGCADGYNPEAALVEATDGNFYGTTYYGGANRNGTIFEITPSGELTTLYNFCSRTGCEDGASPNASLVQATNGTFYGTTQYGGANGLGTVFGITSRGELTRLYSFCSQTDCTDGQYPLAAVVQATDGNLYGTTLLGGGNGYGTLFRVTTAGTLTTLHSFCSRISCTDGSEPYDGLAQDTNGNLYGTTFYAGANGDGTVFTLSLGLGRFVETLPTVGNVGAAVKILGTYLIGATSVTFNGTPATFTVVSSTEISTTVPTGATTGTVQVVTPSGTLSSNVNFRVR